MSLLRLPTKDIIRSRRKSQPSLSFIKWFLFVLQLEFILSILSQSTLRPSLNVTARAVHNTSPLAVQLQWPAQKVGKSIQGVHDMHSARHVCHAAQCTLRCSRR